MKWLLYFGGALLLLGGQRAASAAAGSSRLAFVKAVLDALDRIIRQGKAPVIGMAGRLIVVAHGALESGWGKSTPAQRGFNLFNVTRTSSDTRPVIVSGDLECNAAGDCKPITQRFAAYANLDECVAEYLALLGRRYPAALAQLQAGALEPFATALYKGGYYTLPVAEFVKRISGVLATVQRALAG